MSTDKGPDPCQDFGMGGGSRSLAQAPGSRFCPNCKRPLEKVEQESGSMLNEDQFASVRAGDYFCRHCEGSRGRTGYRYFWLKETLSANTKLSSERASEQRQQKEADARRLLK